MSEVFDACVGRYYSSYFDELVPDYYSMSLLVGSMPLTVVENDYRIFLHDKLLMQSLLDLKRFVYASLPAGRVTRVSRERLCQEIQMEYNVLSDSLYDIFCIRKRKTGRIVRRDILKAIDVKIMSISNESLMYINNPFNTFDRQKRFQYNLSDFFEINKHILLRQFIFDIRNRRSEKMDQLYNKVNASDRATKLFYRRQLQKIRNMIQSQFNKANIPNKQILKEYSQKYPMAFSIANVSGLLGKKGKTEFKFKIIPYQQEQELNMKNHAEYYKWLYLSHYGGSILNVFNYYKRDREIVNIKNTANNKLTIGTDTKSKQDNLLVIDVHLVINNEHKRYSRSNLEDIYKSIQTDTGDIDSLQFVFKNVKPGYDLPKGIPNLFDKKYEQTKPTIAKLLEIRIILRIFMAIQELMPHCTLPHCNIDQRIHLQHLSCVILNSWFRNVTEKQKSEIINFNKKGHAFTWFDFYCYFFDNKEFEIIKAIEETKTIRIRSIRDFLIEHINEMPTIDGKPRYKILEASENAPEHYTKLAEYYNNQLIFLDTFKFQTTSKNTWKLYRNEYNTYRPHDDLLDILQHVYKYNPTSKLTTTLMILSQAQDLFMQICGLPIDEHREVSSDEDESY